MENRRKDGKTRWADRFKWVKRRRVAEKFGNKTMTIMIRM